MTAANRTVLWWSRSGREYARNHIIRDQLSELGWQIRDFTPTVSNFGAFEAQLRGISTPDLVWVPCFRHRDVAAAIRWARGRGVPLVFDPLISAYDKQVFEREKFSQTSWRAARLRKWESELFRQCDLIIADTQSHADYFCATHALPAERVCVIPVGADEAMFQPQPHRPRSGPPRVLFYGSFIGLQGPEVVAAAARLTPHLEWTLLGDGPLNENCRQIAAGCSNTHFRGWVPYEELPNCIADADISLGVFGTSGKASRVIPNKVYQSLACGRTVVTRDSPAYPQDLRTASISKSGIAWTDCGDEYELSRVVTELADQSQRLAEFGAVARRTYERHFSGLKVRDALSATLSRLERDGFRVRSAPARRTAG